MSERTVPLLDLRAQFARYRDEAYAAIHRVVESQKFILGEEVELFEREIAAYCNTRYAVGCASGSDAILLALRACGVQPGDEVLTVSFSFFATAGYIVHAGATPVFVDIDASTLNMDVEQAIAAMRARPKIKAVMPVHLFGACADMDPILETARENGIQVIEDAAQSLGSEYKGRRAGSIGEIGCFSFFPTKNLGAFGDAGICTTNDPAVAERLRSLRMHGSKQKYYHDTVGYNSRLDALHAAVLRVKLKYLDEWTAGRQRNADCYRRLLAKSPVITPAPCPPQSRHIYNQFCICGDRRDELQRYLGACGIGTEIYYPLPLHLQACFASLGYSEGSLPVSEKAAKHALALPIYPELTVEDLRYVAQQIVSFYTN